MKTHVGAVYFLLIAFLAGCATAPAVQPSPTSPPTQAPTLVPTPVPASPTSLPTPTPAPTATLEPTATPSSQVWLRGANMPTRRSSAAAAVLDGRIYVAGGAGPQGADEPLAALEAYDPATDTWEKRAPMPEGRFGLGMAALDGQIYVTGGLNIAEMGSNTWVYDPAADIWSALADMPGTAWLPWTESCMWPVAGQNQRRSGSMIPPPIAGTPRPGRWRRTAQAPGSHW